MVFAIFIAALAVAALLTVVFAATHRRDASRAGRWVFFALVFLFGIAGGIWTAPYGPLYWGVPWFGIIFWSLLVALLLAATTMPSSRRARGVITSSEAEETPLVLGVVFWMLIVLLVIAIAVGVTLR